MKQWMVVLLLLLALVAMACGADATATPSPTQTPAPTSTNTPIPTQAPPASPTPAQAATPTQPPKAAAFDADIKDFKHQDITVKAGTPVVWTNRDSAAHTTSSLDGVWDSGRLRNGETFKFSLTEPGTYNYRCNIHPSMTATVTVTQ